MSNQNPAAGELIYTRVFDAPRELVFRCMIEPEHLTHFWGPAGGGAGFPSMAGTARTLSRAMPHAQHRTLEGQTHDMDPGVLAPVLVEFFGS